MLTVLPVSLLLLLLYYRTRKKRKKIKPAITLSGNEKPELSEIQIGKSGPLNSGLLYKEHYKEFSRLEKYLIRYMHKRNNEQYLVNVEEINNVLGLADKSEAVQKKNRNEIINDINKKWSIIHKTNEKVILSQRSEYDKRVFEYFIQPTFMLDVAMFLSEKE